MNPPDARFHMLKTKEAAQYLGVTQRTMLEWTKKRIVPAYAPTKRTRLYRESDLVKSLERYST